MAIKIQVVIDPRQLAVLRNRIRQFKGPKLTRIIKAGLRKEGQETVKILKRNIPAKFKEARKGIGYSFGKRGARFTLNSILKVGVKVGKKKEYTEALGTARSLARKAAGKKGRGIGAENLHWPILGTKPRYVNNGWGIKGNRLYVGRMKSTMPAFVIRHVMSSKSLLTTAFAVGARKQMLKEAYK